MTITPEELDCELTLVSAATRFDYLRRRNEAVPPGTTERKDDFWGSFSDLGFDEDEALELLALGEVIARKAHDNRQVAVEAALAAGACWEDIGTALDVPVEIVRDEHVAWCAEQAAGSTADGSVTDEAGTEIGAEQAGAEHRTAAR